MTAHRRAWTLRAGLVALMAAGGLFGVATPALAAPGDPAITNYSVDNTTLQAGSQSTMSFTVAGSTTPPASGSTQVTITSSLAPDVNLKVGGCTGGTCSSVINLDLNGTKDFTVSLIAAQNPTSVQPGQQKSGTVKIEVKDANGNTATKTQSITLQGPVSQSSAPSYVVQVNGFVKDVATGSPIPDAEVTLQDAAGHNFTTKTSTLGAYSFKSSGSNPIAPGTLAVGAQKTGYSTLTESATVQAGQTFTFPELRLESTASAAPSDAGSVPVASPPNNDLSVAPVPSDAAATSNGGSSAFSLLLIVAGVLLVLLGIGAIVLIMMRRRRDEGEDLEDAGGGAPRRGPSPVPASRGNYRGAPDATAVVRNGGYNDRTMVSRGSPMADAPTTIQRPVPVDEYPDPYGAPPPRSPQPYGGGYETRPYSGGGGYGDSGYGDGAYGDGGHGGSGRDGGGYGDRRGGGGPGAPYGGIYGQPEEPRGYESGGYDGPSSRGGYGGYDSPSPRPNSYDPGYQPRGGGYDQPTSGGGYRDSGYGSGRGGHPPADEYEEPRGYDRRGSQPPPESRGRLDWLDD